MNFIISASTTRISNTRTHHFFPYRTGPNFKWKKKKIATNFLEIRYLIRFGFALFLMGRSTVGNQSGLFINNVWEYSIAFRLKDGQNHAHLRNVSIYVRNAVTKTKTKIALTLWMNLYDLYDFPIAKIEIHIPIWRCRSIVIYSILNAESKSYE